MEETKIKDIKKNNKKTTKRPKTILHKTNNNMCFFHICNRFHYRRPKSTRRRNHWTI